MAKFQLDMDSLTSFISTLSEQANGKKQDTRLQRLMILAIAFGKDRLLGLFPPLIMAWIVSGIYINHTTIAGALEINSTYLVPFFLLVLGAVSSIRGGKWHWAVFNAIVFAVFTLSDQLSPAYLAQLQVKSVPYAIEMCTMLILPFALLGNKQRFSVGCIGGIVSSFLYSVLYTTTFNFFAISLWGLMPIAPPHVGPADGYVIPILIWSVWGIETTIILAIAFYKVAREFWYGGRYVWFGVRLSEK